MSLLIDTATQVFDVAPETVRGEVGADVWSAELWRRAEDAGLPQALAMTLEDDGFSPDEALAAVRVAAAHAAPIPLGEAMIANWLFASAGLAPVEGVVTVGPVRRGEKLEADERDGALHLAGRLGAVPYARHAQTLAVVVEAGGHALVAQLPRDAFKVEEGRNLAREPRDDVVVKAVVQADAFGPSPVDADGLFTLGALVRSLGMAGALETVLETTVQYVTQRVQFGRPIGKFQAIQHNLAMVAGEAAAARAAADMASERLTGADAVHLAAAAKSRAGEAGSKAAGLAHQSHGAIGFTWEYPLHLYTQRLWAWRDEFGTETEWNEVLGAAALAAGPDKFWAMITALDHQGA